MQLVRGSLPHDASVASIAEYRTRGGQAAGAIAH